MKKGASRPRPYDMMGNMDVKIRGAESSPPTIECLNMKWFMHFANVPAVTR